MSEKREGGPNGGPEEIDTSDITDPKRQLSDELRKPEGQQALDDHQLALDHAKETGMSYEESLRHVILEDDEE